jgi:hypothetical protein
MSTTVSCRQMQAALALCRRRAAMTPVALGAMDSAADPAIAAIEKHHQHWRRGKHQWEAKHGTMTNH